VVSIRTSPCSVINVFGIGPVPGVPSPTGRLLVRLITEMIGVNREIGRRTDVVGIFPNDKALIRLAASIVIEQNDSVSRSVDAVRSDSQPRPRLAA
jgi:Transposase, Mutator family